MTFAYDKIKSFVTNFDLSAVTQDEKIVKWKDVVLSSRSPILYRRFRVELSINGYVFFFKDYRLSKEFTVQRAKEKVLEELFLCLLLTRGDLIGDVARKVHKEGYD